MAELLLAQAKDDSLGDDARMAELLISPMLVFYISGGVALASGGVALCKSSAENAGSVHEFFLVEMIDAALDAIGFGLTWGEGDLDFANDPDKIIWWVLLVSVAGSFVCFASEKLADEGSVQRNLRYLVCAHLVCEDVFQACVYAAVAGTQAQAGVSSPAAAIGE